LLLLHWAIPISGSHPFRVKEQVVNQFVAPALRLPRVRSSCRQFYASKQEHEVWFRLFVTSRDQADVIAAVRPLASLFGAADPAPNDQDEILAEDCNKYRKVLTQVTRYAIDLHTTSDLVAQQQALICIACSGTDPRERLKAHLEAFSPSYRSDWTCLRRRLWDALLQPGPRQNFSAPGHWLWNIVVGVDHKYGLPWPSAAQSAQAIGIPIPAC
jgi:hypothetical protein